MNYINWQFNENSIQFKANFISKDELFENTTEFKIKNIEEAKENANRDTEDKDIKENTIDENTESKQQVNLLNKWYLTVPCIQLKAEISEGTSKETMDKTIGHFEESSKTQGVIGLAAHNRGYQNNYFENVKKLKQGDEIQYVYQNFTKTYIVDSHTIIKDTDWSWLEEKNKNYIVLITCVENEPEYRRCIQAVEKN